VWWVGVITALVDIIKGFAAVRLGVMMNSETFIAPALCGFFAILGHNYNILQQMRGGRGLAPAVGVMLGLNPVPLVVFVVCWLTGYGVIRRNIYVGTMAGAIATPILLFNAPDALLTTFMQVPCEKNAMLLTIVFVICVQILVRHLEPIRALFAEDATEEMKK
jgi:glycerol-3-phosphate acyltransferase PlsY